MRLSSITEFSAATLAILATPITARPYTMSSCLMQVAADAPCVDALSLQHCLADSKEDLNLLAVSLVQSGCTPTEARETTLAVEECLTKRDAAVSNHADSGPDDLRRRSIFARDTTSFNVIISSSIVGGVLCLATSVSAILVCFSCIRESHRKKKARAAAEAREAARAAAKVKVYE